MNERGRSTVVITGVKFRRSNHVTDRVREILADVADFIGRFEHRLADVLLESRFGNRILLGGFLHALRRVQSQPPLFIYSLQRNLLQPIFNFRQC